MSTLEELHTAIVRLPREQVEELQDWIENLLEDQLEFTDEFKRSIEQAKRDIAEGRFRTHQP